MAANYFYFGHHKCASRYIIAICNQLTQLLHLTKIEYHNPDMFGHDLATELQANPHDFIYLSNAKVEYLSGVSNTFKGFHVIRDPRDIIVSAYFSHLYSHPSDEWSELEEYRKKLKELPQEEGILLEVHSREASFQDFMDWDYETEHILELKYEQMILSPYRFFVQVFEHLALVESDSELMDLGGIKKPANMFVSNIQNRLSGNKRTMITVPELLNIVYLNEFSRKAKGRKQGQEDQKSHYRKGIAGDWKNYFNPKIKAAVKEKYNPLLLKLGYEETEDW